MAAPSCWEIAGIDYMSLEGMLYDHEHEEKDGFQRNTTMMLHLIEMRRVDLSSSLAEDSTSQVRVKLSRTMGLRLSLRCESSSSRSRICFGG